MFKGLAALMLLELLVAVGLLVAVAAVLASGLSPAVFAQSGPQPITGSGEPVQSEVVAQDDAPTDIYFLATGLTPEMEGTAPGQIDPHGAEFQDGRLVVVESNATISAYTLPFTDTTRVWVEYRNMPYTVTVYFSSVEGYWLGSCEIGSAGTAKLWGYCERDPLGDYAAAEVIVAAPQGASIYGIVAARPQSWESPKHQIFLPFLSRGK